MAWPRLWRTAVMTSVCVLAAVALDFVLNGVFHVGRFTPSITGLIATLVAVPAWYLIIGQRMALQESWERLSRAQRARDDALAANEAKTTFMAHVSHELRTPLNAIIGYTEIMMEGADAERRDTDLADLRRVHRAASHLLALITDVLDFSRVETGSVSLSPSSFDVADLAREAVAAVAPAARKNGASVETKCVSDLGRANTDRVRLNQCLLNLLSNAVKFGGNGRVVLSVSREVKEGAEWLVFAVSDNGIGIEPEAIPALFEAFEQDPAIARTYGGAGLGLAITLRLARLMGGDVDVCSQPRRGSTFTLRVPARLPVAPQGSGPVDVAVAA